MCLIVVAVDVDSRFPLVVVANRDEFHRRATEPLHRWSTASGTTVVGGRDAEAGGTWSAVATGGRWAAVTNVREPGAPAGERTRGDLPLRVIDGTDAGELELDAYSPVNVLSAGPSSVWWASNRRTAVPARSARASTGSATPVSTLRGRRWCERWRVLDSARGGRAPGRAGVGGTPHGVPAGRRPT